MAVACSQVRGLMGASDTICKICVHVGTKRTVVCEFIGFGEYCPWGFINYCQEKGPGVR